MLKRVRALTLLACAAALSSCSSSTEAPVATQLVLVPAGPVTFSSLNQARQLKAAVLDQHGDTIPGVGFTWSSSTPLIVAITPSGLATALQNGSANLTVSGDGLNLPFSASVLQTVASIQKLAGDSQIGLTTHALNSQLLVRAVDGAATPVPGATINFAITSGGGSVTATAITDAAGTAATTWTLGAATGAQTASASSGSGTASFTATAYAAGQPAQVIAVAGAGQPALVGYAVNVNPAVRVLDAAGQPLQGISVTFAVAGGGGSITGGSATTNAAGNAWLTSWTVGGSPGNNTVTGTVSGSNVVGNPVTFTAGAVTSTFNIALQNIGPALKPAVQAAFDSAVAKWQRVIYQDVPNINNFSVAAGQCGSNSPALNGVNVDDILILMEIDSIDGPGQILGQAGPCFIRTTGLKPILGIMHFDSADVDTLIARGSLGSVILHEMGHVLGYGTLWGSSQGFGCLQLPSTGSSGNPDTYYSCTSARAMFDSIGGTTYTGGNKVPIENCQGITQPCGAGTYNAHWRESTFFNELMTGYLNSGTVNPLSRLSIAAMEDLGYVVNYAAADAYTRTFTSAPALLAAQAGAFSPIVLGDDVAHIPLYGVDASGRVVRVIRP